MEDIIRSIEQEQLKETVDSFSVGDTVRVHAKIREGNRERIQVFEGTVIKRQNGSVYETFTVRKVDHIEVVRRGKVRRAKLYYLRERSGKSARVKERVR